MLYIDCIEYPGASLTNSATDASVVDAAGDNNWQCIEQGTQGVCEPGYSLTGLCVSQGQPTAGNPGYCRQFCDPDTPAQDWEMAYLCTPTPTTNEGINLGNWGVALDPDQPAETGCTGDQVMCGICYDFFGGAASCGGQEGQYKCCDPSPSLTTSTGTDKTNADTNTSTWNDQITATVKAGIDVEGLSESASLSSQQSQGYTSMASTTWETSTETTVTHNFNETGMAVFQWVFNINDSFGNNLNSLSEDIALTPSAGSPPQCQPGYNIDVHYQTCETGYYLPGYPTSSRRRGLLRGTEE
ncbi:MAG: hypothetical protein SGARI_002004 [Bacillariaceae sp.]